MIANLYFRNAESFMGNSNSWQSWNTSGGGFVTRDLRVRAIKVCTSYISVSVQIDKQCCEQIIRSIKFKNTYNFVGAIPMLESVVNFSPTTCLLGSVKLPRTVIMRSLTNTVHVYKYCNYLLKAKYEQSERNACNQVCINTM